MSNPRKRAREVVKNALDIALPDFTFRPAPYRSGDRASLPVYEVATPRTDISRESVEDELQDIRLEVVLRVAGGDAIFDYLDDLCQPLEAAILAVLVGEFEESELTRIETATAPDGAEPVGLLLLTFQTRARVALGNPI